MLDFDDLIFKIVYYAKNIYLFSDLLFHQVLNIILQVRNLRMCVGDVILYRRSHHYSGLNSKYPFIFLILSLTLHWQLRFYLLGHPIQIGYLLIYLLFRTYDLFNILSKLAQLILSIFKILILFTQGFFDVKGGFIQYCVQVKAVPIICLCNIFLLKFELVPQSFKNEHIFFIFFLQTLNLCQKFDLHSFLKTQLCYLLVLYFLHHHIIQLDLLVYPTLQIIIFIFHPFDLSPQSSILILQSFLHLRITKYG